MSLFESIADNVFRVAVYQSAGGFVAAEIVEHRRSNLVRLTPEGDKRYREMNARFLAIASTMGIALNEADIRKTTEVVRQLNDDVKMRSERLS